MQVEYELDEMELIAARRKRVTRTEYRQLSMQPPSREITQ